MTRQKARYVVCRLMKFSPTHSVSTCQLSCSSSIIRDSEPKTKWHSLIAALQCHLVL